MPNGMIRARTQASALTVSHITDSTTSPWCDWPSVIWQWANRPSLAQSLLLCKLSRRFYVKEFPVIPRPLMAIVMAIGPFVFREGHERVGGRGCNRHCVYAWCVWVEYSPLSLRPEKVAGWWWNAESKEAGAQVSSGGEQVAWYVIVRRCQSLGLFQIGVVVWEFLYRPSAVPGENPLLPCCSILHGWG
jgi:hypothetical protein